MIAPREETLEEKASRMAARELPGLTKRIVNVASKAIRFLAEMIRDMIRMGMGKE